MTDLIDGITVVIPRIPPRDNYFQKALKSVNEQTLQPVEIITPIDTERRGAAINRDSGLFNVKTKWAAFLDDDDYFYPTHLEDLYNYAQETNADLVFPWFDVYGGTDPFPFFEGQPWDNENPHIIPITTLVRTEAAWDVGGFSGTYSPNALDQNGNHYGEDWHFTLKLIEGNYKIVHLNKRTWGWNHHGANTSGLASRW